jgi:amidohydrolase
MDVPTIDQPSTNSIFALIRTEASDIFNRVVQHRRHLHAFPELSYREEKTMEYVSAVLSELGIANLKGVGKTGVTAIITNEHHAPNASCIALRADLDALPIHEQNDVDYKSTVPGVMHACGHDAHTAILLAAAEVLFKHRQLLPKPVKLVFQPAEEKNPGGATFMIADKVLEHPTVERMYALHVFPDLNTGEVGFASGLYMASCDEIHLTIKGKGGHAATPHKCIDPIAIGARLVLDLPDVVNRSRNPSIPYVLSFGHFEGRGATNVIPDEVHIKGTFRTMDEKWRNQTINLMTEFIQSTVSSYGGRAELDISRGYPCLVNDPQITQKLRESAIDFIGKEHVIDLPIRLTSEDFAFYGLHVPICFYRIGVRNEQDGIVHGLHHPKFNIDENALRRGVEMMCLIALSE